MKKLQFQSENPYIMYILHTVALEVHILCFCVSYFRLRELLCVWQQCVVDRMPCRTAALT